MSTVQTIEHGGETITYRRRALTRSKRVTITVRSNAEVLIYVPRYFSARLVRKIVADKLPWIAEQVARYRQSPHFKLLAKNRDEYLKHKAAARRLVLEKLEKINRHYGFEYRRVSIRDQSTRWGSCSRKKNLNFNYKLVFLSDALVEYIIAHELCHLKEMNHSASFWQLVAKTIPDYRERVKALRSLGTTELD